SDRHARRARPSVRQPGSLTGADAMSLVAPMQETGPSTGPVPPYVAALESQLASYLPAEKVMRVRRAYELGAQAHAGQTRRSGEPYITHPIAVAGILADLGL